MIRKVKQKMSSLSQLTDENMMDTPRAPSFLNSTFTRSAYSKLTLFKAVFDEQIDVVYRE
jgi:hypothetical protein